MCLCLPWAFQGNASGVNPIFNNFSRSTDNDYSIIPRSLFNEPEIDLFESYIKYLTKNIGIRALDTNGNIRAMNWIIQQMETSSNGRVETEIFGRYESVIGILKGRLTNISNKIVVLGAHFDTVPTTKGANDNAGGVALLLEACRTLSSSTHLFNYDIYFVAFNGEEQALYGSWEVANHLKSIGKDVIICMNADMILFNDPSAPENQKQGIFYKADDVLLTKSKYKEWGDLAVRLSSEFGQGYCFTAPTDVLHSDHGPFWKNGFPALFAFAGRDSYYHLIGDTLLNPELNLTYALETVSTFTTMAGITAEYGNEILILEDSDSDGLDNQLEFILGTDINLDDSDQDGVLDFDEYINGSNPMDSNDPFQSTTSTPVQTTTRSTTQSITHSSNSNSYPGYLLLVITILFTSKVLTRKKKEKKGKVGEN